jgi:hypothetical protein
MTAATPISQNAAESASRIMRMYLLSTEQAHNQRDYGNDDGDDRRHENLRGGVGN